MFFKIRAVKNFANFGRKHLCWSLFLIKFIKKRLLHKCFLVKFASFFRTPFFTEHLRWLLLKQTEKCQIVRISCQVSAYSNNFSIPVDTRRRIDVETTSCVYWDVVFSCRFNGTIMAVIKAKQEICCSIFWIFPKGYHRGFQDFPWLWCRGSFVLT